MGVPYLLSRAPAKDEVVDELHGGVVHLDVERLDAIGEVIVRPHRRLGDEKAERSGDKRFRDTAGNGGKTGSLGRSNSLKRVQDADYGAEEADERSRGTDGGQSRKAALHFRMDDGDGTLETALGGFDNFGVAHLLRSGLKFAQARGNDLGDMALLVALGDGDCFIQLAIL